MEVTADYGCNRRFRGNRQFRGNRWLKLAANQRLVVAETLQTAEYFTVTAARVNL